MTKFAPLAVVATLATFSLVPVAAQAETIAAVSAHADGSAPIKVSEGKMIYGVNGQRLAPVYRVNSDGWVQLILEGRLVTLPATGLSEVNGKLTSPENKADLLR